MIFDAIGPSYLNSYNHSFEEAVNEDAEKFYNMLNAAQCPLWPSCIIHTKLSVTLRTLSIKFNYNTPHGCFDKTIILLKEANLEGNLIPPNFYETKKLVSKLGLRKKI